MNRFKKLDLRHSKTDYVNFKSIRTIFWALNRWNYAPATT